MLRAPVLVAIALAVAFAGGISSSFLALGAIDDFGALSVGPWRAWPERQTARADPYTLAERARTGRILLGEGEGLTFVAAEDSTGRTLSGSCRYTISGTTPAARFWTLHVTGANGRDLSVPDTMPGALHSHAILRRPDGSFSVIVAPDPQPGNWIAMRHAGPVHFVLTLFDTPVAGNAGLISFSLPEIAAHGCGDA